MGVFSWNCAHCGHSVLVHADVGINDWMQQAVVLSSTGDRYEGVYDGYGRIECEDGDEVVDVMNHGGVMAHLACWEVAGKPEFWHYREHNLTSPSSEDQGYFFDEEHDVIDPRVTDPVERERLLGAGRAMREENRLDEKAREVGLLVRDSRFGPESWNLFFWVLGPVDGKFALTDKFRRETVIDATTEEQAEQHALRAWSSWLESEEFAKLKKRSDGLVELARLRWIEKIKLEGRFKVGYKPARGDTVLHEGEREWTGGRSIFYVHDRVTSKEVAVMDGPDMALGRRTFVAQPGYDGNNSPEWEARVEEFRAAQSESRRLADEEAKRLNDEWAAAGYPMEDC